MSEQLGFRAHARLLTMLGEQLIRNERVALVELIKNSYDADASKVSVDFVGFDENFAPGAHASIVVTDDGVGMSDNLVRTAWMNPATPTKKIVKLGEPRTRGGRVLQGEKGIGRFATFKIGSEVKLITRAIGASTETTLVVDISVLDEGSGAAGSTTVDLYLDDIPALLDFGAPRTFDGMGPIQSNHGTQLRISGLRASWNRHLVDGAYADIGRLQPLMWSPNGADTDPFVVTFLRDGSDLGLAHRRLEEFDVALQRAVLKVQDGRFDQESRTFTFSLNGKPISLSIDEPDIRGLKPFRDRFLRDGRQGLPKDTRAEPVCGSFGFEFYIFDLTPGASAGFLLDGDQRALIKENRIYLYRDGIRVYPYGDPDDDWLEIDIDRGTESAGRTFSNDQVVGHVEITQQSNPQLRDKTSREGLIDAGPAVDDFKALIKTVLRFLRQQYQPYIDSKTRARKQDSQGQRVDSAFATLRKEKSIPPRVSKVLEKLENDVEAERKVFTDRLARTEQLAGVGLSVETASHDLILAGTEALRTAHHLVEEMRLLDMLDTTAFALATQLVSRLEFISSRFNDVQGLFVSTRQRSSEQDIIRALRRVKSIYARLHESAGIDFQIDDSASLRALSTEAAVLQLLINLVDNATYWLVHSLSTLGEKKIIRAFTVSPDTLVVSDNGPGIRESDIPFIFEPFYSGKGDEGKGLGLYIARQNGLRSGFAVTLAQTGDVRALPGASFVVRFGEAAAANGDS